jgi:hypothetical protein
MSKYVPSFSKSQDTQNQFAALAETKPKTLAELTSTSVVSAKQEASKGASSYASKFSKNVANTGNTSTSKVVKAVDVNSENDFPSLGGSVKKATTTTNNFAAMAKSWAKTVEEEEAQAKQEKMRTAKEKATLDSIKRNLRTVTLGPKKKPMYIDDDDYDRAEYGQDDLCPDDDYRVPSGDEISSEDDMESEVDLDEDYYNHNR